MKKLTLILIIAFIFSCTSKKRDELIGSWYYQNEHWGGIIEFQFLKDSVFIYDELGKKSGSWEVDNGKIHIEDLNGPFVEINQLTYLYKLDQTKKFLNLNILRDSVIQLPKLTKAKSIYDFIQKTVDLEIELPVTSNKTDNIGIQKTLTFSVYAGFKNNNLVVKTDFSSNLNDLNSEVNIFKESKRKELRPALIFNLFADKKLKKTELDSIKSILKQTSIKKIVRTYKNNQTKYEEYMDWFVQKNEN